MGVSYTTGAIRSTLTAVRCAHRPCMESGKGRILFEVSPDHEHITVTPIASQSAGYTEGHYSAVVRCQLCMKWNGIRWQLRKQAA